MGRWSGLIVVAILVLQIVASIIQQRRKEQEKQRAREAAARRQMLAEAESQAGTPAPTPAAESPAATGDLEARRRAQLEQLRQRREGRRVGMPSSTGVGQAPPTSPRAGLPLPGTGAQPQAPTRLQQQTWTATSDQARSRQQEIERRAREQGRQMREQQARLAEEREAAQRAATERERARREARETQQQRQSEQQQRQTAQRQAAAALAVGGPVVASQLRNRLGQPGALREVLVLKEILDPPLSLRDPNHLSAG